MSIRMSLMRSFDVISLHVVTNVLDLLCMYLLHWLIQPHAGTRMPASAWLTWLLRPRARVCRMLGLGVQPLRRRLLVNSWCKVRWFKRLVKDGYAASYGTVIRLDVWFHLVTSLGDVDVDICVVIYLRMYVLHRACLILPDP